VEVLYVALTEVMGEEKGPQAILARTVKGHGVPELEAESLCHVMAVKPDVIDGLLGGAS